MSTYLGAVAVLLGTLAVLAWLILRAFARRREYLRHLRGE